MHDHGLNISPGMKISHFRLEKLLGEGGMGVVYLAEDITLTRKVAIKFMHKSMLANLPTEELREQVAQRFIREAKSIAGISHTNLCQVYEANFSSDNWYIVMEFINGKALDELLDERGIFTENEALKMLNQTAQALKFAWDKCKIVHRDIKPQNIMFTTDNFIKIVDLGLAKPVMDYDEDDFNLTNVGMPVGTPFYMSPEQAVGGIVDYRADMFALGATFYELLTGEKTYNGKTIALIYRKKLQKEYKPLKDLCFSENISTIIDRLLEPEPHNRYESYDELILDIRLARKGKPLNSSKNQFKNFDPMEDTIDELGAQLYEKSQADPMAETIDEKAIESDPMAETIDEKAIESDPMAETINEKAIESDPMAETIDEKAIESDPMAETMDNSQEQVNEEKQAAKQTTPSSKSVKIQALATQQEQSPKVSLNTDKKGNTAPKKSGMKIFMVVIAVAAILTVFLTGKFNNPQEEKWPSKAWLSFIKNYNEQSGLYHFEGLQKLEQYKKLDGELNKLTELLENENLKYLCSLYEANHLKENFNNIPEITSKELNTKIEAAVKTQEKIREKYRNLKVHQHGKHIETLLDNLNFTKTTFTPPKETGILPLSALYEKLDNAQEWIKQTAINDALYLELVSSDRKNSKKAMELAAKYADYKKIVDPYTLPITDNTFYDQLSKFLNTPEPKEKKAETAVTNPGKNNISFMKAPLQELATIVSEIEKSYDYELYQKALKKLPLLEDMSIQASEKEKMEFSKLKVKLEKLKKEDFQLSIQVKMTGERTARKWPAMEIIPSHKCHYVVVYDINGSEARIVDPIDLSNKVISAQSSHKTTPFPIISFNKKKFRVWVIAFTYLSDLKKFYELGPRDSSLIKYHKFQIDKMEEFLNKTHSNNFDKKVLETD